MAAEVCTGCADVHGIAYMLCSLVSLASAVLKSQQTCEMHPGGLNKSVNGSVPSEAAPDCSGSTSGPLAQGAGWGHRRHCHSPCSVALGSPTAGTQSPPAHTQGHVSAINGLAHAAVQKQPACVCTNRRAVWACSHALTGRVKVYSSSCARAVCLCLRQRTCCLGLRLHTDWACMQPAHPSVRALSALSCTN